MDFYILGDSKVFNKLKNEFPGVKNIGLEPKIIFLSGLVPKLQPFFAKMTLKIAFDLENVIQTIK